MISPPTLSNILTAEEGRRVTVNIHNRTDTPEVIHWHGLFLPPDVDGAMEEGTPMILPGAATQMSFVPQPAGFRWYHTHTFAGHNLTRGQYTGQHGFLWIEPCANPARYDAEFFLALHDWRGQLLGSGDGSMNPSYEVSTINGRPRIRRAFAREGRATRAAAYGEFERHGLPRLPLHKISNLGRTENQPLLRLLR